MLKSFDVLCHLCFHLYSSSIMLSSYFGILIFLSTQRESFRQGTNCIRRRINRLEKVSDRPKKMSKKGQRLKPRYDKSAESQPRLDQSQAPHLQRLMLIYVSRTSRQKRRCGIVEPAHSRVG